jgi:Peptidase family S41
LPFNACYFPDRWLDNKTLQVYLHEIPFVKAGLPFDSTSIKVSEINCKVVPYDYSKGLAPLIDYISFSKDRKKLLEDFKELKSFYLTPSRKIPFAKPLILLTNDQTASAADVLTLISRELPATTIIGEPTSGIFSDMYAFELPNKWIVTLSNQRYYSSKMTCYESIGVPVDIIVKNSKDDIINMFDSVLQKAVEIVSKQNR